MLWLAGETLLEDAVQMSLQVGLVRRNDHIVVVQMISDSFVVKVGPSPNSARLLPLQCWCIVLACLRLQSQLCNSAESSAAMSASDPSCHATWR